jgi:type III secretion protein O
VAFSIRTFDFFIVLSNHCFFRADKFVDVLKNLLRIKIYREEKAELAVARARHHLRNMDKALDDARRALDDHLQACKKKEKAMYQELCSRLVLVKEIDEVTLDVKLMQEASAALEKKIEEAKEARTQAAESVEISLQVHRDAVRMREKFMELTKAVDEERAAELLRFEDLELEEAASSRHASAQAQADAYAFDASGVA